jgi:5'-methylthioadenosine phosphorylase
MDDLRVGLIGGTGLGEALGAESGTRHQNIDTPFGRPSDDIIEAQWAGATVLILSRHGPGHVLNPSRVPYRANIFALKQLGCTHILASGATGSLREEFKPRDLVIPEQIIDRTSTRERTFFDNAAVHVEFAEPFCPVLRRILVDAGSRLSAPGLAVETKSNIGFGDAPVSDPKPETLHPKPAVHDRGCYVCMEGPAFSTRAESLMHRLLGGDLIGMTAMPEARLAKEAEIPYALIALVTDYDCWRPPPVPKPGETGSTKPDPFVLLNEIKANLAAATANAIELMRRAVELMASRTSASSVEPREELADCPAIKALQLAIWSDKSKIPAEERQRLAPLWMKYFE